MWIYRRDERVKLLSIDQAFNKAGFAYFEDGEYKEHGSYKVNKDEKDTAADNKQTSDDPNIKYTREFACSTNRQLKRVRSTLITLRYLEDKLNEYGESLIWD